MNQENYEIIKRYFGIKFIQYIINYDGVLSEKIKLEELKLNKNQIDVLKFLDNIKKECWQLWFTQSETKDGSKIEFISNNSQNSHTKQGELFEFKDCFEIRVKQIELSTFNNLRRICGGHIPQIEKEDPVFEFLSDLTIKNYPYLLIKYIKKPIRSPLPNLALNPHLLKKSEILLKQDILNKLINKKEGFNYEFCFKLSNRENISHQISLFCETIVRRAFQNSCNQMNYTLEDC